MVKKLSNSYQCACGAVNEFSGWVYAHWDIQITHKCPNCSKINLLCQGKLLFNKGNITTYPISIEGA